MLKRQQDFDLALRYITWFICFVALTALLFANTGIFQTTSVLVFLVASYAEAEQAGLPEDLRPPLMKNFAEKIKLSRKAYPGNGLA